MIEVLQLFPVHVFKIKIADPEEILTEINSKKDQIRQVSESSTEYQSVETYKTDYSRPVKINSFESQIISCLSDLEEKNLNAEITMYWTAIYSGTGHHSPHTHARNQFEYWNYSGVLYLCEGAGTNFYSPSVSCVEKVTTIKPEFGTVILFPSTLLHSYVPLNSLSKNERCIMSFNVNLTTRP